MLRNKQDIIDMVLTTTITNQNGSHNYHINFYDVLNHTMNHCKILIINALSGVIMYEGLVDNINNDYYSNYVISVIFIDDTKLIIGVISK